MKVVIEYLNTLFLNLENQRNEKERLLNSKIIENNEVRKMIVDLTTKENDTYNFFSASGSRMEFNNREIVQLKSQEDNLSLEIDGLTEEIKNINVELESLAITIAHANTSNAKLESLSSDVIKLNADVAMYATGGKKPLNTTVESIDITKDTDSFLEEIMDRIYFISRLLKFDPMRVKLELDEVYKAIKKFINK